MPVTQIRIASRITKSSNYQSGTGEYELVTTIEEGEHINISELRDEVVEEANIIANESLAQCPRRK